MIRAISQRLLQILRSLAHEPVDDESLGDGRADLGAFSGKVDRYRRLGAKIGEKVRFLGDIDGVNPHLVSVDDYSVIGKSSVLLAHCPIKGARAVSIGRCVYIGYGAIILPGVTLDDYCVVGAGAVVTKSATAGSILAGNPARVLRHITPEEQTHIDDILKNERVFGWDPNRPA